MCIYAHTCTYVCMCKAFDHAVAVPAVFLFQKKHDLEIISWGWLCRSSPRGFEMPENARLGNYLRSIGGATEARGDLRSAFSLYIYREKVITILRGPSRHLNRGI